MFLFNNFFKDVLNDSVIANNSYKVIAKLGFEAPIYLVAYSHLQSILAIMTRDARLHLISNDFHREVAVELPRECSEMFLKMNYLILVCKGTIKLLDYGKLSDPYSGFNREIHEIGFTEYEIASDIQKVKSINRYELLIFTTEEIILFNLQELSMFKIYNYRASGLETELATQWNYEYISDEDPRVIIQLQNESVILDLVKKRIIRRFKSNGVCCWEISGKSVYSLDFQKNGDLVECLVIKNEIKPPIFGKSEKIEYKFNESNKPYRMQNIGKTVLLYYSDKIRIVSKEKIEIIDPNYEIKDVVIISSRLSSADCFSHILVFGHTQLRVYNYSSNGTFAQNECLIKSGLATLIHKEHLFSMVLFNGLSIKNTINANELHGILSEGRLSMHKAQNRNYHVQIKVFESFIQIWMLSIPFPTLLYSFRFDSKIFGSDINGFCKDRDFILWGKHDIICLKCHDGTDQQENIDELLDKLDKTMEQVNQDSMKMHHFFITSKLANEVATESNKPLENTTSVDQNHFSRTFAENDQARETADLYSHNDPESTKGSRQYDDGLHFTVPCSLVDKYIRSVFRLNDCKEISQVTFSTNYKLLYILDQDKFYIVDYGKQLLLKNYQIRGNTELTKDLKLNGNLNTVFVQTFMNNYRLQEWLIFGLENGTISVFKSANGSQLQKIFDFDFRFREDELVFTSFNCIEGKKCLHTNGDDKVQETNEIYHLVTSLTCAYFLKSETLDNISIISKVVLCIDTERIVKGGYMKINGFLYNNVRLYEILHLNNCQDCDSRHSFLEDFF
jgi:hypothetical protein